MKFLKERVSYLKGLVEGMNIQDSTNEGKLLKAIIDVMDDMALAIDDLTEAQEELSDLVDDIDQDLNEVEKLVYEDEECDGFIDKVQCPNCKEIIEVYDDMIDEDDNTIECPECHEKIAFEWECDCGCDDCDDEE